MLKQPIQFAAVNLCAVIVTGCAAPRSSTTLNAVLKEELGQDKPLLKNYRCTKGAHRGSSADHTENTLVALRAADDENQYAFIEFDVQYTEDGRIVVFHDKRLFRLFGSLKSIGGTPFDELAELTGGEVCSYDAAMDVLRNRLNIEIKSQGDTEEDERLADELMLDLRARGRTRDVMISSISSDVLRYIKSEYPEMPTGKVIWLTSSTYLHFDGLTEGLYEEMDEIKADYLLLHVANLRNIEDLLKLKPKGKTIIFWDFDDKIYLVHKDGSDRLWGQSGFSAWWDSVRFKLSPFRPRANDK